MAPIGIATQSSTYFGSGPEASLAIDGNTNGDWGGGSISHTDVGDPAPWWQVDLGTVLPLDRIVLWNRTDCCAWRLSNFRVSVLDGVGAEVHGEDLFTDQSYPNTPDLEVVLPPGIEGQVVRVDALGPNVQGDMYVSLAEVQVFAESMAIPLRIVRGPRGGHIQAGTGFTFSVALLDDEGVTFKWIHGVEEISGAASSTYEICSASPGDSGSYTVTAARGAESVTSVSAGLEVVDGNLALHGVASQSTTGFGSPAHRAIDGNVDGSFTGYSLTHTANDDPTPWWEVALVGPSTLERIVLWNRTDPCCSNRLSNFRVSVLGGSREAVHEEDFFTDGIGFPDTATQGFEVPLPPGTVGRFVRVEIRGPNAYWADKVWLTLAEVEVIGTGPLPPEDPNLARGRPAEQSSTLGPYAASFAVDGVPDDFTHTDTGESPAHWQVDLCGLHDIEEIVLHNRKDCCGSRLRDITVYVLDAGGANALFTSELLNPENSLGAYPDGPESLRVNLTDLTGAPVKGGVVRIERSPDDDLSGSGGLGDLNEATVLSLSEVEVFKPVPCPASGDTHCSGLTLDGPAGGGPGDYTVTAAATDDSGDPVLYTFEARHAVFPAITVGPQNLNSASLRLLHGTWALTVTADDVPRCPDEASDSKCTRDVVVTGDPENVALDGTATQSSTDYGAEAYRAIDGITDGDFGAGSVTHTADGDPAPWWQVDLGQVHPLDRIVLWNRTDCCPERFTDFRVSVLDDQGAEVHGEDFFQDGTAGPDTLTAGFVVSLPPGTEGRTVRIDLLGPSVTWSPKLFISLAEVQVFRAKDTGKIPFHRGDVDGDGAINVTDPIVILEFLYLGGGAPACLESANADDSDGLDITDPIVILTWLYLGGEALPAPGPVGSPCGEDPAGSPSDLGCGSYTRCTP